MSQSLGSTFTAALDALGVGWSRTTAAEFPTVLADVVDAPAVGTPLPFEGVSLADSEVTVPPTPTELESARTGVTPVFGGIADYGTVVVESRPEGDEPVALYPERHVAVLRESDLAGSVEGTLDQQRGRIVADRRSAVLATGVSATADMGATVEGVHGPREVHVIVLTDR